MVINTNIAAMAASRTLAASTNNLSSSLARLSSGSKIVSPEDDAAGLAMSIRFDAQINRNRAVVSNLNNAISFSQTQDGFLVKAQSALDRMSQLSILAQDMTKTDDDREAYDSEYQQLVDSINAIATKTFNGVSLFQNKYEVIDSDADSWTEAKADAESRGGYLATITSGRENAAIVGMLGNNFEENLWIGGTDENAEGTWEWVTGEDWSYENWTSGEPNNSGGNEDHAHYWGSVYKYKDGLDPDIFTASEREFGSEDAGRWNDYLDDATSPIDMQGKYVIEYDSIDTLGVTIDDKGNTFNLQPIIPIMGGGSVATNYDAKVALIQIKESVDSLGYSRADVGANIARLKSTVDSVGNLNENLSKANSRIKDVDVAEEATKFARNNILVQSGTAMLSQANMLPSMALQLLG